MESEQGNKKMSESEVNKHLKKGQGTILVSNNLEYLANYNTTRGVSSTTELLIQFLTSVMIKDYEKALKYCTEILQREPNNCTALEFFPLIVEKLEMIENEEIESTSSESSLSSSSTSEENESDLFIRISHNEGDKSHTDKMRDYVSNVSIVKEGTRKENTMGTNNLLNERSKKVALPTRASNKATGNEAPFPSNLLIHPTETKTLIGNNASNMRTITHPGPKKGKQTSYKLQKRPSKTVTFPKKLPPPNLAKTEIPERASLMLNN